MYVSEKDERGRKGREERHGGGMVVMAFLL